MALSKWFGLASHSQHEQILSAAAKKRAFYALSLVTVESGIFSILRCR